MTFATPHLRLVVAGTLFVAPERFSWSLNLPPNFNNEPYDEPTTVPPAVISAVTAFHQSAGLISSAAKIDSIKLNLVGTDGKYVNPTSVEHVPAAPGIAGATALYVAPQLALAITLRTAVERGLASRGRFFVPLPTAAPGGSTDPRISAASAQSYANAATTLINALNTALAGWRVGVVSDGGKFGAPINRNVTHVEVGRVIDTIRSRRTSLPEEYAQGAAVAA